MDKHFTVKEFFSNILNGIGVGIVIALIPNAILGVLFSYLSQFHPLLEMFNHIITHAVCDEFYYRNCCSTSI